MLKRNVSKLKPTAMLSAELVDGQFSSFQFDYRSLVSAGQSVNLLTFVLVSASGPCSLSGPVGPSRITINRRPPRSLPKPLVILAFTPRLTTVSRYVRLSVRPGARRTLSRPSPPHSQFPRVVGRCPLSGHRLI